MTERTTYALVVLLFAVACAFGQATGTGPDVLVFKDGEKLIGHLVSADDTSIVFKSDGLQTKKNAKNPDAGNVIVDWGKIQEVQSSAKFAVIPKGVVLRGKNDTGKVAQGAVTTTDQQVQVKTAAVTPQSIPVTNVAEIVGQSAFEKAFRERGFLSGWTGGASAGIAYTQSTQKSENFSGAINLSRPVPGVDWADPRSNTLLTFNGAYGKISQTGTPTTKTALYHAGIEQDFYFNSRVFVFGQGLWDHNYSQGLNLQQDYGGGLGFVIFKKPNTGLDVRASVDYIRQQFALSSHNMNLIGSIFGENYFYKFGNGILFSEKGGYIPTWNNTNAYSAFANATLTFPVYHRFGFTIGALDTYLNNPPVGFKKNSFTLTMGAAYSLQ
ncbi:MAG: DUF481 domain-containing protein [Acidobacteriaceae bacterium]|nr:DUF481 domain-containing protein [Acidobacteriaceae bacterium]MBV8569394.1 DUF481 domain-containing protein [Acidobacteriaceae bacterium]